jgi:hypothetical protein
MPLESTLPLRRCTTVPANCTKRKGSAGRWSSIEAPRSSMAGARKESLDWGEAVYQVREGSRMAEQGSRKSQRDAGQKSINKCANGSCGLRRESKRRSAWHLPRVTSSTLGSRIVERAQGTQRLLPFGRQCMPINASPAPRPPKKTYPSPILFGVIIFGSFAAFGLFARHRSSQPASHQVVNKEYRQY